MSSKKLILSTDEVAAYYALRVPNLKQTGTTWWHGPCPLHGGEHNNFKVDPESGNWRCHSECGRGGSVFDFEMEFSQVDSETARSNVLKTVGRDFRESSYIYRDKAGDPQYRVVRHERGSGAKREKSFHLERIVDGGWIKGLGNVKRIPYNLEGVVKERFVFVVEGEKDCDTMSHELGLVATTNPLGASNWSAEYNPYFVNKHVAIIPDNDNKGRAHALCVAENLISKAASIRVIELPDVSEKGDITDWVDAGGTAAQLVDLWKKALIINIHTQLDALRSRWGLNSETSETDSGFNPQRLGQSLSQQKASKDWLWKGRLVAGTVGILASKPKVGKSTMARNLALAVARGSRSLGGKSNGGQCYTSR